MTDVDTHPANGAAVERPPDVALVPAADQVGVVVCRYCPERFPLARGGQLARGVHEKKEHRTEWEQAKQDKAEERARPARAKARSAKKARSTPRSSATPSGRGGRPATPPRQSAAQLLELGVKGLGQLLGWMATEQTPWFGPMSMMVSFEAPIAGSELDAAAAGTVVDKVALQPLVSSKDRLERIGPLIAAPLIVGFVAAKPEAYAEARPMLRACIGPMLPAMLAELRRKEIEEAQIREAAMALAEVDPTFAEIFAGGGDPIDAILARIFPPPADGNENPAAP